jgi:hypothetical protein
MDWAVGVIGLGSHGCVKCNVPRAEIVKTVQACENTVVGFGLELQPDDPPLGDRRFLLFQIACKRDVEETTFASSQATNVEAGRAAWNCRLRSIDLSLSSSSRWSASGRDTE